MSNLRTFDGQYVTIEYDPELSALPVRIRRKSSGEIISFFAPDLKKWMLEVLRIMILRKIRPDQVEKFLWPKPGE